MQQSSQNGYIPGPQQGGAGLITRALAFVVGLGIFAVSVFLGAIFIAAIVGFMLIGGLIFMLRIWWIRRKMEKYAREHGDLEAEYTVVRVEEKRR